jgi:uncharacterized protein
MLIHELTQQECRDVLSRAHLARLACSRHDQPYVVPISFSYDSVLNALFSFSAVGRKVDWMRDNPKVCVEVADVDDRFHWTTVIVFGRYNEIDDAPERSAVRERALGLFKHRAEWWLPGAATSPTQAPESVVIYRVDIDSMSGRRADRNRA